VGCFHGVVALGCSSGVTFVLLPRGLGADAGADAGPKVRALLLRFRSLVSAPRMAATPPA
jgi:hypothetical protein